MSRLLTCALMDMAYLHPAFAQHNAWPRQEGGREALLPCADLRLGLMSQGPYGRGLCEGRQSFVTE